MEGLSENLEDYLETILVLQTENTVARVKGIAEKLGVLRGKVTSALRSLSNLETDADLDFLAKLSKSGALPVC